jgi:hypothetical protein
LIVCELRLLLFVSIFCLFNKTEKKSLLIKIKNLNKRKINIVVLFCLRRHFEVHLLISRKDCYYLPLYYNIYFLYILKVIVIIYSCKK